MENETTVHPERASWGGLVVFFLFLCIYLSTISRYYTGDTIYYAVQIDRWIEHHERIYQFFPLSHVLVVPIGVGFSLLLKNLAGMGSLASQGVMAAFFGAGTVGFLYMILRRQGLAKGRSFLLCALFGISFGIWDYSTVGEDRIQGLFLCAVFLYVFLSTWQRVQEGEGPSWKAGVVTGLVLGLAASTHLSNGILFPFLFFASLVCYGKKNRRSLYLPLALFTACGILGAAVLLACFGNQTSAEISSLGDLWNEIFAYHSQDMPYFLHTYDVRSIAMHALKSGIGIFTAVYYAPEAYIRTTFQLTPIPVLVVLASLFLAGVVTFLKMVFSNRPNRMEICLWALVVAWAFHSFLFEAVSRADWLPILLIGFVLMGSAWRNRRASTRVARKHRFPLRSEVVLVVILLSMIVRNAPHMVAYHQEKNLYVQFVEFCVEQLPEDSLLVMGNGMAVLTFDYFRDQYDYPFDVVTFFQVMGIETPVFARLKPPPQEVREIDSALEEGRPVFVTKRTLEIPAILRKFLEMEYPQETIDAFLSTYDVKPFRRHAYSDIYQVFPSSRD